MRLTLLYGALFVLSGACLLAITYLLILRYSPAEFLTYQAAVGTAGNGSTLGPLSGGHLSNQAGSVVRWTGLGRVAGVSGVALAIMAAVSVATGWFVAGRTLRPIRSMTVTARTISEHNLDERLAVAGPDDELKLLGDTIDALLDRVESLVNAQRQFAANASHELRTPLTLERTLLESALTHPDPTPDVWRSTCERVLAGCQKQAQLIEALLMLARSQQTVTHRETLDLASATSVAMRALDHDAAAREIALSATLHPCPVSGDPRLVEQLVTNLVQNAIRHNHPGGHVRVAVGARGGRATLQVANSGPDIPADQIDRLMKPFQRLGRQRSGEHAGAGLGLSIAAAISQAHGASLLARPGIQGGLDIEVSFPPTTAGSDLDYRAPLVPFSAGILQ